jgi:hypothetical protein
MVTRKPSPAGAAAGAAGAAGAAAGGATAAAAATGAATAAAAGLGGGGSAVLPWLAKKDWMRASAADTLQRGIVISKGGGIISISMLPM